MNIDLRGFDYALEPIRRQHQWRLDAVRARLGAIQREIDDSQQKLAELRESHLRQSEQAAQCLVDRFDPGSHTRALQWLVRSQAQILHSEQALSVLYRNREAVQAQCLNQQRILDVIEEHRSDSLAEFASMEAGRLANEADRDWLSRQSYLQPAAQSSTGDLA